MSNLSNMPWEDRPVGSKEVVWRYSANPIIPRDLLPTSNSIFNSAVVPFGDSYAGVFRCDDTNRRMRLHVGFSKDAVHWDIHPEPLTFECDNAEVGEWVYGYDPRVCFIEDRYYVTWCNGYKGQPTIGVAWTKAAFCDTEIAPYAACTEGEASTTGSVYTINSDASAPFDTVTGKEFVVIQSTPVLNGPFAYNSDALDPADVKAIQDLFTSDEVANNEVIFVPEDSENVGMFEKSENERFVMVDDSWFDPIRDLGE